MRDAPTLLCICRQCRSGKIQPKLCADLTLTNICGTGKSREAWKSISPIDGRPTSSIRRTIWENSFLKAKIEDQMSRTQYEWLPAGGKVLIPFSGTSAVLPEPLHFQLLGLLHLGSTLAVDVSLVPSFTGRSSAIAGR